MRKEDTMAIFQDTHPKEQDVTEKHTITIDEIRFLKKLQHELNVQDSMGNRDPRFWVIRQSKDINVSRDIEPPDYDYITITDDNYPEREIKTLNNVFDAIQELTDSNPSQYEIKRTSNGNILATNTNDGSDFLITRVNNETAEIMDKIAGDLNRFHTNYIQTKSYVVPNTLFLTHESCEEHLRKYGYNYEPDAHAYAMTADRSPEYEALIRLLRTVDFEMLEKAVTS